MKTFQHDKKRLNELFRKLDAQQRISVLDFVEFLSGKTELHPSAEPEAVIQARPEKESVVKAIRRLSGSYPMLEKSILLNETSMLMSQHVMQGKEASEVIDNLEVLFAEQYQLYLTDKQG